MTDKTISFSLNGYIFKFFVCLLIDQLFVYNLFFRELLVDPAVGDAAFNEVVGKKHALKRYDQFTLNTSCFWGSARSNITPVMQFHEIFITKMNKSIYYYILSLEAKLS